MSIDAVIIASDVAADKQSATLYLRPRSRYHPIGQHKLHVVNFDGWLPPNGSQIWGNSDVILIGETPIYKRLGYIHVEHIPTSTL